MLGDGGCNSYSTASKSRIYKFFNSDNAMQQSRLYFNGIKPTIDR